MKVGVIMSECKLADYLIIMSVLADYLKDQNIAYIKMSAGRTGIAIKKLNADQDRIELIVKKIESITDFKNVKTFLMYDWQIFQLTAI